MLYSELYFVIRQFQRKNLSSNFIKVYSYAILWCSYVKNSKRSIHFKSFIFDCTYCIMKAYTSEINYLLRYILKLNSGNKKFNCNQQLIKWIINEFCSSKWSDCIWHYSDLFSPKCHLIKITESSLNLNWASEGFDWVAN